MTDLASLSVRVTTQGVDQASKGLDDLAKSGDKAAKSTDTLNKSFNQAGGIDKPAKAAAQAFNQQTAALAKLAGQIDPTVAKLEKLDVLQAQLAKFKKSGMISADDFAALNTTLDASRVKIASAGEAVHKFSLNNAMARRELGYLAKDLATGQYGRFQQSALTLANASGVMSLAFSGIGLVIGGVVAALGAFAVAAFKGSEESEKLRVAVIATGGAAGVSAAGFNDMAVSVGAITGKWGDARKAVEAFAASGKVAGAGIGGLARQAVDMATVTGESIDKAVAKIIELNDKPAATIANLNEQYHFLTSAQYAMIAALEDEGKTREASRLANQLDARAMADRAKDVEDNAGIMQRAGHAVAVEWGKAWDSMKGIGRTAGLGDQVKAVQDALEQLQGGGFQANGIFQQGAGKDDPRVKQLQAQLAELRRQQVAAGFADAAKQDAALANAQSIAAQQRLSAYRSPKETLDNQIKKANSDRLAALYGIVDPVERSRIEKQADDQIKAAQSAYAAAMKKDGPKSQRAAHDFRVQDMNELRAEIEAEGKLMDQRLKSQAAVIAYRASLQDMLDTRQATIDLQVASLGMGDKEIAQQQALIAIDEDYNRQKASLERQQRNSTSEIDKAGYGAQLADLAAYHDKRVAIEQKGFERSDAARGSWEVGAKRATQNYLDNAKDIAGATSSVVTNVYQGLTDNLAEFFAKGKADWKGFVTDILLQIEKIEIAKAVAGIASSFSSAIGPGTIGAGFAKGGVFESPSPSLSAYSGQIVSQPTAFAFAKGAGIMGEAGPEAILPLSRGADGKLGVKAGGSGGDVNITTVVNVDSNGNSKATTGGDSSDAGRQLGKMIESKVRDVMTSESRPGGTLWRMQHA
ncbi:lambda family phage tail tape measure protein [Rhodanobacter sp. TND4EL1]